MAVGLRDSPARQQLITYHPSGGKTSAQWFHNANWLDFNMLQNGHSASSVNYGMIEKDYAAEPPKPCMDGEPSYEYPPDAMPPKLPVGALQVRRNAYWAVFVGAHGHTYGTHPIWQMYDEGRQPRWNVTTPWHQSMDLPGANQLIHLKCLMFSRPFLIRMPDQGLIDSQTTSSFERVQATRDGQPGQKDATYIMVYFPSPLRVSIDTGRIGGNNLRGWWMDPRSGEFTDLGTFENTGTMEFEPPEVAGAEDWILALDDAGRDYPEPGKALK